MGEKLIQKELSKIKRDDVRKIVYNNINSLNEGKRDLYL
ncbi:hypothetical protein SDC9_133981 [bioreactor metagenome]|uniref:Uncharacterized protein n=2 Tax=root TaxID=1 RepID=A0A645DCX8_9ZZZZ